MLQLPTPNRRAPVRFAAKTQQPPLVLSDVETAIADHKRAMRIAKNRDREEKALHKKHPAFADIRPSVLFWTRPRDGKKFFGRGVADYDKIFHPSIDHISPGNVAGRKKFEAALEAARPDHIRRRRQLGITRAESRAWLATLAEWRAFSRLLKTKPRTKAEVQRFAKYLIVAMKYRAGGAFHNVSSTQLMKMGGWDAYDERVRRSHTDLCRAIYALARK